MTATTLLLLYCPAVVCASLAGGFIPHWIRLTHTRLQTALSFTAGAMLGVGLLHLVPHAYFMLKSIDRTMLFTLLGFLVMFFIERVFHFHHHASPDDGASAEPTGHDHECDHGHHHHEAAHEHGHDHDHGSAHHHGSAGAGRQTSWAAAFLGLALHSLLDGVALAASVNAEAAEHGHTRWAGLAVFLVVVLHKPFDSLTLATLTAVGGHSSRLRHGVNAAYACAVPLGALLFQSGLISFAAKSQDLWVGSILALAAGTFLCISTSDLLPELQFHTHDRGKLSAALLAGLVLAWGIVFFEERGHDHHGPPSPAPSRPTQPTQLPPD
jgi:zinc and cadmium transporter